MASVLLRALLPTNESSIDDAREIGAIPVLTEARVMRVERDPARQDQLVYAGETVFSIAMMWRVLEYAGDKHHGWWRLEGKVPAQKGEIDVGTNLVIAAHPYSAGWVGQTTFKPGSHKGPADRLDLTQINSPTELINKIENLRFDFWEKGDKLTAGISVPCLPALERQPRNFQQKALWVFGACKDFKACQEELLATEKVQLLLKMTEENRIAYSYRKKRSAKRPRLSVEVIDKRHLLMSLAIQQALAGPHKRSDNWVGEPVTKNVDNIYCGLLNCSNKTERRNRQREGEYRTEVIRRTAGDRQRGHLQARQTDEDNWP